MNMTMISRTTITKGTIMAHMIPMPGYRLIMLNHGSMSLQPSYLRLIQKMRVFTMAMLPLQLLS